jgi:hypothetical protein
VLDHILALINAAPLDFQINTALRRDLKIDMPSQGACVLNDGPKLEEFPAECCHNAASMRRVCAQHPVSAKVSTFSGRSWSTPGHWRCACLFNFEIPSFGGK